MNQHKDKERLRYQKQAKLLDDLMKVVPRRPHNASPSKVRKLRHLVLYYHFMQKVHAQITEGHHNIIKDCKKSAKKKPLKSENKHLMIHHEPKRKVPRANIVFLQADRSKSRERNISDEPIINYNVSDNCSESFHIEKKEYQIPKLVAVNNVDGNSAAFDQNLCLPTENIVQTHSNNSGSPGELILQSDLASEDYCKKTKGNHSPIISNLLTMNSIDDSIEKQPASAMLGRISKNIIINNDIHGKPSKTDFQNILQDYSNNSTLRDVTIPSAEEKFYVANVNFPGCGLIHYLLK